MPGQNDFVPIQHRTQHSLFRIPRPAFRSDETRYRNVSTAHHQYQCKRAATALGVVLTGSGEMPKSYVGVPIVVGSRVIGTMDLQNMDRENAFSDSDIKIC